MAKSKKKSTPLESTIDQGNPKLKPNDSSESTEPEPLSEEQINTMLDDIGNSSSSAIDHVERDQVMDDVDLQEAESMSETQESSNVSESTVDPVVQDSIEEISNEALQEMLDDQPTSDESESKSESEVSDDSGDLEPSVGEASDVMSGLDLNIESESNSIIQDSVEEIDHENLQNASDEEHAFDESQVVLDVSMTDTHEDLNHLDSDKGETHEAIDESELILESGSHSVIHDSVEEINQKESLESSNEGQVSDEVQAESAQDDTDNNAQLAVKEVYEALRVSSSDNEDPSTGVFDNSDSAAMQSIEASASEGLDANDSTQLATKMTDDSQRSSDDVDDPSVVIDDEIQSTSDSGTQQGFLESTENEIVDLIEEQHQGLIEEGTDDTDITDDNEIVIETSPRVDLIETNTPADQNLDDESKSDSEHTTVNAVSTAKPTPTEPLEQNHTNNEVLNAGDKSDIQDAQSERTTVSDPVHSSLEPKSHPQKVNYLLVSSLALIAIVMATVLAVYSFTLQSQVKDTKVMLVSFEEKMELISARIDRLSATDEKIRRINVRLDRLGSKISSIGTPMMPKETSIENNEKPAKQDEILPGRIEQEPASGIQTHRLNKAAIGETSIENKRPTLQPNKKRSLRSSSAVQNNVATPKSAVLKGDWSVNLISLRSQSSVEELQTNFQKQGVMAKIKDVTIGGKQWYRLQVLGFSSKQEATAYVTQVEKKLALNKVWVIHK